MENYISTYEVSAAAAIQKSPEEEAAKIQRKMKKLYDLFMEDLIDKDEYRKEYARFQEELQKIHQAPIAPRSDLSAVKTLLSQPWEEVYKTFANQEKNTFWKSIIQSIIIHEDGSMDFNLV